jgi:hypothetical protein
MNSREVVLFKGEPFSAKRSEGSTIEEFTPYIFKTQCSCGLGILELEKENFKWSLVRGDIFALYRATEILRSIKVLYHGVVFSCYCAGLRNYKNEHKSFVESVIKKISQKRHQEIMKKPIPEEITRILIEHQHGDLPFILDVVSEEIKSRTLIWRDDFFEKLKIKKVA